MKLKLWNVRIYRKVEDSIGIRAETAEQAEAEARNRPGVMHVFPGMTVRGDFDPAERAAGVEDEG